jgi:opacity protein-like surface antigen
MPIKVVLVAVLLIATAHPAVSQAAPDATHNRFPFRLAVGVGVSDFYSDWSGRLDGATVWADVNFYRGPEFLRELGLEVEGRDLNYGRTGEVANLRQDTAEGGPIFTLRHFRKLQPYGKCLFGFGSIDFQHHTPPYSHDTRTLIIPGGGVEYRTWRTIWVRGDYEYQFWTNFVNHHALNPNGFTVGVEMHFD